VCACVCLSVCLSVIPSGAFCSAGLQSPTPAFESTGLRHMTLIYPGVLVYKALHDSTAAYLVDDCQLVSHAGHRRLRSADIDTCCVPRTNTWFGDPTGALQLLDRQLIRQPNNGIGEFRRQLKSFLFK